MSTIDFWKDGYYKKIISASNLVDYLVMFQVESYKKTKFIKKNSKLQKLYFDEKNDLDKFSESQIKSLNHYL